MKELESLGLTKREIGVYLALLELGSSSVGEIVKKSGVPSSKIYEVLDKLVNRGLVSFVVKGKTRYFQASEPEVLLDIVDDKRRAVEGVVPELKARQRSEVKGGVSLFEGVEGMKTALRKVLRVLKPSEDYYVYIPPHENLGSEASKIFFNNFNLQRGEAKIKTKLLIHKDHRTVIEKEFRTLSKKQVRYTDFSFPSRLGIFRNYVLVITHKKNVSSILIHSEETYRLYLEFFLNLWKQAKT